MEHRFHILCTTLWILVLAQQLCAAPAPAAIQNASIITTTKPLIDQKAAASNEEADDAKGTSGGNSNVYGPATSSGASAGAEQNQNKPNNNKGYNQGYSYNSGIKPYRTGYTYYQPFGDAVNEQQPQQNGNTNASGKNGGGGSPPQQQQVPADVAQMLGIDPKQFGPVRVIPNQNVPLDENGIPNLDAIKIPENNQQQMPVQQPAPRPQVQQTPGYATGNDFNLNQILGGGGGGNGYRPQQRQQQYNPANDNSMFDFAPPSSQNFDFAQNGGATDGRDYNRLDDFAGNLNNFDTYLGDPNTMMNNNGGGGGANSGLGNLAGQTVPSEIVNLNNAFGSNTNQQNNNDMMNILNQMNDNGNGNQGNGNDGMADFGNFGNAATNQNQFFPFF